MNQLVERFGERIRKFWSDTSDDDRNKLVAELREYANANPARFESECKEIIFDKNIDPLPVVLEVLSKNTNRWGQFYVDVIEEIFFKSRNAKDPKIFLNYLDDYAYVENDTGPFIDEIADCLFRNLESENLYIKLAVIRTLPYYTLNPAVGNKGLMIDALRRKLTDKNWQVRYVAFKSLGFENLLPEGQKLSLKDRVLRYIFGEPYWP